MLYGPKTRFNVLEHFVFNTVVIDKTRTVELALFCGIDKNGSLDIWIITYFVVD